MLARTTPMNGRASSVTSGPVTTRLSTARLLGPASAIPAHWSVMLVTSTASSGHTAWR